MKNYVKVLLCPVFPDIRKTVNLLEGSQYSPACPSDETIKVYLLPVYIFEPLYGGSLHAYGLLKQVFFLVLRSDILDMTVRLPAPVCWQHCHTDVADSVQQIGGQVCVVVESLALYCVQKGPGCDGDLIRSTLSAASTDPSE